MNRYYLEERKVKGVNAGVQFINNHNNIQPIPIIDKFNFRKAYCHFEIKYNWWLAIVVDRLYLFLKLLLVRPAKALLDMLR